MDAPPIQYARTEDGVNLAYWTLGERTNPALILVPWGVGHLAVEWEIEQFQAWYERLASRLFLVHYDARGSGLSQRGVRALALDRFAADIAVVAKHAQLDRYGLLATAMAAPPAIVHASDRAESVSHLVLLTPIDGQSYVRSVAPIRRSDWDTYRHTLGSLWTNWSQPDTAERLAEMLNKATTREDMEAVMSEVYGWDVTAVLPRVRAKTLVFGIDEMGMRPLSTAQDYAAAIPDAQLIVTEGFAWPELGRHEVYAAAIEKLVFGETVGDDSFPAGLRTLLFTDLESSTELTRSLGDEKAQEVLRGHNESVRAALAANGGSEVKHTGDGIMASFSSAVSAVAAALQIQRDLVDAEVRVRVGLNAGEPIAEDDDYFGLSVIKAARIADRTDPGQVLVSNVVRELCEGKRFTFTSIGEVNLKGFDEAVTLYRVELG